MRRPRGSRTAELVRLGFRDPERAETLLSSGAMAEAPDTVVTAVGEAADPDQALLCLSRVVDAAADPAGTVALLAADAPLRQGAAAVLGTSEALADHLVRHPEDMGLLAGRQDVPHPQEMRGRLLAAVGADPRAEFPVADVGGTEAATAMRRAYRAVLLTIATADLTGVADYDEVVRWLSQLADAALESALAIARYEVPDAEVARLAVIAMGKCGAEELNYVSDVDVIFVVAPMDPERHSDADAVRVGAALATALMRVCTMSTPEGPLWEVDPALRPEGKAGALVRTLDSHVGYYERWAQTWEFQALLKARAAAGDRDLGRRYVDATGDLVWQASGRENFVEDVQAMRRRVEDSVATGRSAERQLKLGPGGLRDVEFSVQMLQLVHGRGDAMVRTPNTMLALEALANYGYVGRKDAAGLAAAYRFLRTLEHRLQLYRLQRTHVVPDGERDLRRVARSLGFRAGPEQQFAERWREVRREVRRLHEKLFYRPLLQAVARLEPGEVRLTPEAAGERLVALGFRDPTSALRHLEALTAGVSRRAAIQRTLLPVLLGWFADSPDPDAALLKFRMVSDALGATPWYLRLLRDESVAAHRLAVILGSSRYASDLLLRAPEAVAMLAEGTDLTTRPPAALESEAMASAARHDDPQSAIAAVRVFRRRELFRVAVADCVVEDDPVRTAVGLTDVTAATVTAALQVAVSAVAGDDKLGIRFLVVGMGRFGGREMSYASDADVLFVHDPLPGVPDDVATRQAIAVANELRRLLALPSPDPELLVDADLRPEGRNGPMSRSLASYRAYYERWSSPWEAQALLRATPVAGDPGLGEEFLALIDPLRYPAGGLSADHVREMRRLKARMESERLPRGADPALHTKLGPGGLSDVEWTVQLLQMQHGHRLPELRTTRTLPALREATVAGLLDADDAEMLHDAWSIATRIRNAIVLATGKPGDQVPKDPARLALVAHLMGYQQGDAQLLVEDYRRVTRRARQVVDRVFYAL